MDSHIIYAYRLDGLGAGTAIDDADVAGCIAGEELAWVHLDGNMPESREWVSKEASYLDSVVIDALLEQDARNKPVL